MKNTLTITFQKPYEYSMRVAQSFSRIVLFFLAALLATFYFRARILSDENGKVKKNRRRRSKKKTVFLTKELLDSGSKNRPVLSPSR